VVNVIYSHTEQTIVAMFVFSINSKMAVSSKILFKSEMYIFSRHMCVNIVPNPDNISVFSFRVFKMDTFSV